MESNRSVGRETSGQGTGRRKFGLLLGVVLLIFAVAAIFIGRDDGNKARFDSLVDSVLPASDPVDVGLLVGSEKKGFLADPRVVEAFREEGFNISVSTMGSLEIAQRASQGSLPDHDFYFPASSGNAELKSFVGAQSQEGLHVESNIALVAKRDVAEDLASQGYLEPLEGQFQANARELYRMLTSGQRWRDVTDVYQSPLNVGVLTSDPTRSYSSAQFAYLMADAAMGGSLRSSSNLSEGARRVLPIFQAQGLTEGSSGDSFNQFIASNGHGTPMTVAYDSQFLALVNQCPEKAEEFALINLNPTVRVQHELVVNDSSMSTGKAEDFIQVLEENQEVLTVMMEYGFAPSAESNYRSTFDERTRDVFPQNPRYLSSAPTMEETTRLAGELERLM